MTNARKAQAMTTTENSTAAASIYMGSQLAASARQLVSGMARCDGVGDHAPRRRRLQGWAVEVIARPGEGECTRLVATGRCPVCASLASSTEAM